MFIINLFIIIVIIAIITIILEGHAEGPQPQKSDRVIKCVTCKSQRASSAAFALSCVSTFHHSAQDALPTSPAARVQNQPRNYPNPSFANPVLCKS